MDELARLGKDPSKVTSTPPSGDVNAVFDLSAIIVEDAATSSSARSAGTLADTPSGLLRKGRSDLASSKKVSAISGVELTWTERIIGDYDQNGEVNLADITPMVLNWGSEVAYDDPALHGGFDRWPSGDPDSDGATNWRLARIDGDSNGEVNTSDITPIAMHFQESLDGYRIYRKAPGEPQFTMLPPTIVEGENLTLLHPTTTGSDSPVRYSYFDGEATPQGLGSGVYEYYVASFDSTSNSEGPASDPISITLSQPPIAVLTITPFRGNPPLDTELDASDSTDPDGQIVKYEWDWEGDGIFDLDSGNVSTANHTFEVPGDYSPTVRVTDSAGLSAVSIAAVHINSAPEVNLTADPLVGVPPFTANFDASASTDPDGEIVNIEWDWESDGTFDQSSPDDLTASHEFDGYDPVEVTLRLTDNDGLTASASVTVHGNHPPEAVLTVFPTIGASPMELDPSASQSSDSDGTIVSFEWDWEGDGVFDFNSGTEANVIHEYVSSGTYTVTVRVTDNDGSTDTAAAEIIVDPPPEITSLLAWPDEGPAPLMVNYTSHGRDDYNEISSIEWDFEGDGVFEYDSSLHEFSSHYYEFEGQYSPAVRYTNSKGLSAERSVEVNVLPDDGQPHWHAVFPIGPEFVGSAVMTLVDGWPAIIYTTDFHDAPIYYVRAQDALGLSWGEPVLINPDSDQMGRGSESLSFAVTGGNPSVLFLRENLDNGRDELLFLQALDAFGDAWGEPVILGANPDFNCEFFSLAEVNGSPAVTYSFWGVFDLFYRRAQNPEGSSWNTPLVIGGYQDYNIWDQSLKVVNGVPAVAFDPGALFYVRATDANGDNWLPQRILEYGSGGYPSLIIVDGYPAISHYSWGPYEGPGRDLEYIRALDQYGDSWGANIVLHNSGNEEDVGRYSSMAIIDGVPTVAYWGMRPSNSYYLKALDSTGNTWGTPEVLPKSYWGISSDTTLIELQDGSPAVCYEDTPVYAVYF